MNQSRIREVVRLAINNGYTVCKLWKMIFKDEKKSEEEITEAVKYLFEDIDIWLIQLYKSAYPEKEVCPKCGSINFQQDENDNINCNDCGFTWGIESHKTIQWQYELIKDLGLGGSK